MYATRLDKYGGINTNEPAKHVLHFCRQLSGLMDLMINDADNLQGSLTSLRTSLPRVDDPPSGPTQAHDLREKRSALLMGSTILIGIFGTLMGWFTHQCLNNLRDQIGEVGNQQHRLLQIQQVTLARLDDLETVLQEVVLEMERAKTTWVNYFALDHARIQLHFHLQKLTRALQAAHLRRLSVDLLDGTQLRRIFDTAARKAKSHHYQLMLCHPSDLFQIKTSYLHNGQDVNLILHIPMAPANSILRLFQLHSFPLPFTKSHILMPGPANQIIDVDRLSVEMSVANFMSCHRINSAYLCERHGVMRRELNSTCLGSLYIQDFPGTMTCAKCESWSKPKLYCNCRTIGTWYIHLLHLPVTLSA
jgi:hypothetical protein